MVSFDALRAANIGALAYICRPKVKPAELQALFPLNNSTENLANTAYTIASSSFIDGVFSNTKAGASVSGVYELGSVWTVDFYTKWVVAQTLCTLNTRVLQLGTFSGIPRYIWNNSDIANGLEKNSWHHIAFTCDGTSICAYFDGTRKSTITATSSSISFSTGTNGIQNLRVVSKCLTTDSTFPVPSDLYTGFEPL